MHSILSVWCFHFSYKFIPKIINKYFLNAYQKLLFYNCSKKHSYECLLKLWSCIPDSNPNICSSKGKVPVWPFLTFSFFGGVYALLPYFVLWRPPPPPVEETELRRWPLNFLESKITAGVRNCSLKMELSPLLDPF